MIFWAPVTRNPIASMGHWNFEVKIWSLMEGIGMEVFKDNNC